MPFNSDKLRTHLARMVGDLPVTFRFNGTNYTGILSDTDESKTPQLGGFRDGVKATINVPLFMQVGTNWVEAFATEPRSGDTIIMNGGTLQVVDPVVRAPDGVELILSLGNPR